MMPLEGKRIFVVEDNVGNRAVLETILDLARAEIFCDRWGRDIIKKLDDFAPVDLILLDLMLPNDISGFSLYDEIRAHPKYDHVPIVAITAMHPSVGIPKSRAKGFSGYLAKPIVDYTKFIQQLITILDKQEVWEGQ